MERYGFHVIWSEEDEAFLATCPEFPGLTAFGETRAEALEEAGVALELFLEEAAESGTEIPAPRTLAAFSGQFRARLPRSLHATLARQAEAEGVSLNALIATYLSAAVASAQLRDAVKEAVQPMAAAVDSMGHHLRTGHQSGAGTVQDPLLNSLYEEAGADVDRVRFTSHADAELTT